VWRAAAQLHSALAGQQLLSSDFRVPRFATLRLDGWVVREVVARGKHLLMRLQGPGSSSERLTIHSHLKMEGAWQVYPPGGRWRKPGFTARCVLRTAAADAVGFSLGILEVVATADEDSVVGHLGPDLLGPDWDAAEAQRRLLRAPDVPVGVALLDQRNLAGIGNIYRCETCFLSGIHPASPISEVADLPALLGDAKRLLEANLGSARRSTLTRSPARADRPSPGWADRRSPASAGRGSSVTSERTDATSFSRSREARPGWRSGYWVYGREHQPCLRCGTPIRRGVLAKDTGAEERTIYFCPGCQPEPGIEL
jgi:endonuclease-8